MREYELYLVIDAEAEEAEVSAMLERASELLAVGDGEAAGEVLQVTTRGARRLTYPIRKKKESQDIILNFQTSPQALPELERYLKLHEQVLRFLLVRTDES
jgi:small subunit ribosomal protein S6